MISLVLLFAYYFTNKSLCLYSNQDPVEDFTCRNTKMSSSTNHAKLSQETNPLRPPKGNEVTIPEEEMTAIAGIAQINLVQPLILAKEMGEISEKLSGIKEENNKLREKLKRFREDNAAMKQKIGSLEDQKRKQEDTIRSLESSQEKLLKELENVKNAKDKLRIDLENKISTLSAKNTILTEKFEALTKDFEAVENENKELKRSLDELTGSNNSLQKTVESIGEENAKLKDDIGILKEEHAMIREKLRCKETRLALGEVAWLLEKEIWLHVLPDKKMGTTRILNSMERYLKKNASSEEKKRWEDLKGKLNWDEEDHKSALKILKDLRLDDAHPKNVDLEVARKQLKEGNYVAETEKKSCEEIINMIVAARKLNNTTE